MCPFVDVSGRGSLNLPLYSIRTLSRMLFFLFVFANVFVNLTADFVTLAAERQLFEFNQTVGSRFDSAFVVLVLPVHRSRSSPIDGQE